MLQKAEEGEEESGTVQLMMMPYFGSSLSAFLRLLFPLFFLCKICRRISLLPPKQFHIQRFTASIDESSRNKNTVEHRILLLLFRYSRRHIIIRHQQRAYFS